MNGDDIIAGSPLALSLDDYRVPGLGAGFADRVLAAVETRAAPLSEMRRSGGSRWRLGRRLAIGAACFGVLATAAAATGVLERFDIPLPSPEKVWASVTGNKASAVAAVEPVPSKTADPVAIPPAPVVIDGPIDTPEELSEVFRRIDAVRQGRMETRRELTGQRIDRAIERRREAGLPVPPPDQEARLRQRIDEAQALRQERADQRIASRRDQLERKVESGAALTREDILGARRDDAIVAKPRERLRQLRQMIPKQRREALRALPPEQRRALIEEYDARPNAVKTIAPEAEPAPLPLESASPEPAEPSD